MYYSLCTLYNGIIQYILCLFSFAHHYVCEICTYCWCSYSSFIFRAVIAVLYSILWSYHTFFSILLLNGYLGCFQFPFIIFDVYKFLTLSRKVCENFPLSFLMMNVSISPCNCVDFLPYQFWHIHQVHASLELGYLPGELNFFQLYVVTFFISNSVLGLKVFRVRN